MRILHLIDGRSPQATGCTLNLLATRLDLEIVQACDLTLIISDRAHGEALFLHAAPDAEGVRSKEPASTERLRAAGTPTVYREYQGMIHGFLTSAGVLDQGKQAIRDATAALREAFAGETAAVTAR